MLHRHSQRSSRLSTMEHIQDLVVRHDAGDSFALAASACDGAIRLRASGRRTLIADHHEHQLHIHLVVVLGHEARRELRANKSGSVAEFLAMGPGRRASAVGRVVGRARFPPGCAGGVARFCELAGRAAHGRRCDDVLVTVDWTPALARAWRECGEVAGEGAGAGRLQFARGLCKYALVHFGLLD
jgi:hypothetical protein